MPMRMQKSDLFVRARKLVKISGAKGEMLSFVFADSPDGGGEAGVSDASDGRAYLLHKAKRKITARAVACTVEPRGGFRTARFGVLIQR